MQKLIIPKNYRSQLDLKQTEQAIKNIKDFFQLNISTELQLRRITAPLFVMRGTGINDDLNGIERPVSFEVKDMGNHVAEVVQSLAKWKRMILADYNIAQSFGIYTDMNAIRPDEELGNIHSIYVDQWDWEKAINAEDRTVAYLKKTVTKIYSILKRTEFYINELYPQITPILPEEITFIHAEQLLRMYPDLSTKEREDKISEKHGAVFIIGIGAELSNGEKHDGRAPDYDDWSTANEEGYIGLNGDIILWNPVLNRSFEISSMGIRVDKTSLIKQLTITNTLNRKELMFHKRLLNDEFPLSVGGGIGQSRLCMFFLRKAHIGEIQSSIWPTEMHKICNENNIFLI